MEHDAWDRFLKTFQSFWTDSDQCHHCLRRGLYYHSPSDDIVRMWFSHGISIPMNELDKKIMTLEAEADRNEQIKCDMYERFMKRHNTLHLNLYKSFKTLRECPAQQFSNLTFQVLKDAGPRMQFFVKQQEVLKKLLESICLFPQVLESVILDYVSHDPVYLHIIEEVIDIPEDFKGRQTQPEIDTYISNKWSSFVHAMNSTLDPPPREWTRLVKRKMHLQNRLPMHWDPFPTIPRTVYMYSYLNQSLHSDGWRVSKLRYLLKPLFPQSGLENVLFRDIVLCRDCIFRVTNPEPQSCPWLFDTELFPPLDASKYEELYTTYLDSFKHRQNILLKMK